MGEILMIKYTQDVGRGDPYLCLIYVSVNFSITDLLTNIALLSSLKTGNSDVNK